MIAFIGECAGEPFGVTEIARHVGVPKSTAHRLLKELEGRTGRSGIAEKASRPK